MVRFYEVIKNALWVLLQFAILIGLICANAWLIYTNFTALKVSFELQKYDATFVGEDLLTGPFWESLGLYELTQAHMFAAAIALFVGLLSAAAFHHTYVGVRLLLERREYAKNGDTASLGQANLVIIRHLVMLALVLIPLVPVAYWDLQLFRFRNAAVVLGMEDNAVKMKDWHILVNQYGDLFAMSLTRFGAWAYISLVAGAGLAVEFWINYVREALVRLVAEVQAWYQYVSGAEDLQVPRAPLAGSAAPARATQQPRGTVGSGSNQAANGEGQAQGPQRTTAENFGENAESVSWPERETISPNYASTSADQQESDEEVTVYGGRAGEKIKVSAAAADHENYYIDEMRRVWRRTFSADQTNAEPADAAA